MTQYANLIGYSDVRPYEIIARTKRTITVRAMKAVGDPSWEPVIHVGGFAAHCSNQSDQKWIITSDPTGHLMKAYLRKDGHYHSPLGRYVVEDKPRSFYDFNF